VIVSFATGRTLFLSTTDGAACGERRDVKKGKESRQHRRGQHIAIKQLAEIACSTRRHRVCDGRSAKLPRECEHEIQFPLLRSVTPS
jgi:hypothetical protein